MKQHESLYAWFQAPVDGIPEQTCAVPHRAISVVPGMGQWVLVHLRTATRQEDLPEGMVSANLAADLLGKVAAK